MRGASVVSARRAGRMVVGVLLGWMALAAVPHVEAVAQESPVLRVGLQAGGTFGWEMAVMEQLGLDRARGLRLQKVQFATKTAAETGLRAGTVDVLVDDWVGVSRMREQGIPVQAVDAFSRAVGGILVSAGAPIRTPADLRGRRIGVVSLQDKSYLVLRAVSVARYGFDPQRDAEVVPAAPPLLNRLLERGDLDAIVQYWQFVPGMTASGRFRELASTVQLIRQIRPDADLPFLVVAATDDAITYKRAQLAAFLDALRESKQRLASDETLWDGLLQQGVLGIDDPALIPGLRQRYREGLPGPWDGRTVDGLSALTAALIDVAGEDVVGVAGLQPSAYNVTVARR
ncbi:ABC transporter substrate-binding protein [Carboxydochorda subterranea]|uniref:ABC transporter substrate-binding protein n=1 Tax=Carboxydichorda subterranea TaxID=3109565 RepID=A0ABZ1BXP0_9FIRM|nr:ABC transporter substrate-binding protein [Limnochorda sp. L945t]WRP17358.1 ABC transporter substrate-binding protein [Limnochorda sp. L945t]